MPPKWETYTATEGRFKVDVRGLPKITNNADSSDTKFVSHIYTWDLSKYSGNNIMYAVTYVDYPMMELVNNSDTGTINTILKTSVTGMISRLNANNIKETNMMIQGHVAKDFKFNAINYELNGSATYRIVMVKNRLYLLQVWSNEGKNDNPATERFLKSFTLL